MDRRAWVNLVCSVLLIMASLGAGVFVSSWGVAPQLSNQTINIFDANSLNDPFLVKATGAEFRWLFRYSGQDGVFDTQDDIDMGNALIVPPNRTVNLLVVSEDYVYSLSQPRLGIREIAVPGIPREVSFKSPAVGSFVFLSDPLCGVRWTHDEAMGTVTVKGELLVSTAHSRFRDVGGSVTE